MSNNPLTGEVSNSKLAAVFESDAAAREAAAVLAAAGLQPAQVKLVAPGGRNLRFGANDPVRT